MIIIWYIMYIMITGKCELNCPQDVLWYNFSVISFELFFSTIPTSNWSSLFKLITCGWITNAEGAVLNL